MNHMPDTNNPAEFYHHLIKKCPRLFPNGVTYYTIDDADNELWAALFEVSIRATSSQVVTYNGTVISLQRNLRNSSRKQFVSSLLLAEH